MIVAGIQVRQISGLAGAEILSMAISAMLGLLKLAWCLVTGLFRYRAALQAEILILRHQLNVLRRKSPKRFVFSNIDRLVFAGVYGLMPSVRNALKNSQSLRP